MNLFLSLSCLAGLTFAALQPSSPCNQALLNRLRYLNQLVPKAFYPVRVHPTMGTLYATHPASTIVPHAVAPRVPSPTPAPVVPQISPFAVPTVSPFVAPPAAPFVIPPPTPFMVPPTNPFVAPSTAPLTVPPANPDPSNWGFGVQPIYVPGIVLPQNQMTDQDLSSLVNFNS